MKISKLLSGRSLLNRILNTYIFLLILYYNIYIQYTYMHVCDNCLQYETHIHTHVVGVTLTTAALEIYLHFVHEDFSFAVQIVLVHGSLHTLSMLGRCQV